MTHRICVSILPETIAEALRLITKAEEVHADLIEVRIDKLEPDANLAGLVTKTKTPLIATNKSYRDEKEKQITLIKAVRSGFEYADVDLSNPDVKKIAKEVKASGAKCIISFHDNKGTPSIDELNSVFVDELSKGANVCKIIATANCMEDNLTLLNFTASASIKAKIVCFGMGKFGKTSRLLSPLFGGFFTFASLQRGSETAPGQMAITDLMAVYNLLGLK